jgi:spermidine synthase
MPKKLAAYYVLFAVSGFCGLIYESIWAKYLKLFLGHAAYAQTVVLVVFIGGMAIGAWLCGRFSDRIRQPLLLYAGAELLVGACAVAFHPLYESATSWAYDYLLPATCDPTGFCYSSWAFAALLILPQSILLGSTFPLMTAGILRAHADQPGRKIALLYFLNSIGAVVGVLASTFLLVPWVGLPGASLMAGIVNVALALAVYVIARWKSASRAAPIQPVASHVESMRTPRLLLWVAALTGLSSFVYEVVWIRLLSLVLGASTHAFEIMLASFIFGLALGGLWIRGRIDRLERPLAFLGVVQIVMGLLAAVTIPLANQSFDVMAWLISALAKEDSGYVLYNIGSGVIAAAIMSPPTFFAGMTLPLITYSLFRGSYGEGSIGRVYSANTAGSIVGVILGIHVGLPMLGVKGSLLGAAAIDVVLGIALLATMPSRRRSVTAIAWALAGLGGLWFASAYFALDPLKTASGVFRQGFAKLGQDSKILFHRDGKTATVDVIEAPDGIVAIRTNGKTDAAIKMRGDPKTGRGDEETMTLLAALPLAHSRDAKNVAVIGFGSGMTTSLILTDPLIRRVDTIEIEPAMIEGAANFLPVVDRAFHDPRGRIVLDDAKSFFARSREQYDIIVSEPSNPWVSGVASLFTEEFYLRAKRYLAPGGVFAQWLHVYEFDPALLGSITSALGAVFPEFDLYASNDGDLIVVARNGGPLGLPGAHIFDYPEMRGALKSIGIEGPADLRSRHVIGRRLLSRLLFWGSGMSNSDFFPYVDLNAPRARFKKVTAGNVVQLAMAPVPVIEMLELRPVSDLGPPATAAIAVNSSLAQRSATAERLVTFFDQRSTNVGTSTLEGIPASALAAIRTSLVDCGSESAVAAGWDGVVEIAEVVNPGLPGPAAERFWADYATSPCLKRLPKKYRVWVRLFSAVAARDSAQMIATAEALLEEPDKSPRQIEYLVLAGATGYLVEGRAAEAKRMLFEAMRAMPTAVRNKPWFVLERELAGGS